jgi:hypothetical protein
MEEAFSMRALYRVSPKLSPSLGTREAIVYYEDKSVISRSVA